MKTPPSKLVTHICVLYVLTCCLTVALVAITFFGSMKLDSLRRDLDMKLSTKQLSRRFLRCVLEYDGTKLDREPLLTKELSEDKSHDGESGLLDLVTNSEAHEGRKKWGHMLVEKTARLRREISMNNTNDTNEEPNELNWLASFSKNLMKDMKTYCQESRFYCAAQGKPGPKGDKGDLGSKGNDGSKGMDGPPGPTGITGPKGDKGNHGDKGERGDHGNKGERGDHGDKGERGDHGDKGESGFPGFPGLKGEIGLPGDPGLQGLDGVIGIKGEIGDKGAKGEIGDRGAPGPTGSDGHPGNEGKPGLNGTDGQSGSVGPQGEKGERGEKGEKGEFGDKGELGPEGPPGPPGPMGPHGFPGVKGEPGLPGAKGMSGNEGQLGLPGRDGSPGPKGDKGDAMCPYTTTWSASTARTTHDLSLPSSKHEDSTSETTTPPGSTATTTVSFGVPTRKHVSYGNNCTGESDGNNCTGESYGNNCTGESDGNNCTGESYGNNCTGESYGNNYTGESDGNNCTGESDVCSIQNIDHPMALKSYTAKHGAWFRNFPLSNDDRLWVTFDTEGQYLYEYADVKALLANSTTTVYDLRSMNFYGTGHIIFNNSFYYHRSDSWDIVRYDLRLQSAVKLESLHPEAQFFGSERLYHNTPGVVDFAADETGLWVIYANHYDHANQTDDDSDDVFFLASLDPETLQIGKKFTIKHPRSERGNSFLVCGVLYVLPDTFSKRTNIQFSFDPYTEEVSDGIRIPFSNAHSDTAQLTYNPIKEELLSWDSGTLVVLPVKLVTFV